jgi:hypothetical protein
MGFPDPSSEKERNPAKKEEAIHSPFNRRKYSRYFISEIAAGGIGKITEISKGGLKIKKPSGQEFSDHSLTIQFLNQEIRTDVVWQDKNHIGVKFAEDFGVELLIKKAVKRLKESESGPEQRISDNAIASVTRKDVLSSCIMLMTELDSPDADYSKLKMFVEEISDVSGTADASEEKKPEETREEEKPAEPEDLKELILYKANSVHAATGIEITDIDFAIARLGLDAVKKISVDFFRKKISQQGASLTGFENYKSFSIFKTVIFRHLAALFSFKDEEDEGSHLLSLETRGIDILMSLGDRDLTNYYISPQRLYAEISRYYEKKYFGRDILEINKNCFEHNLEMFENLYDGYILAHLMLNPCYAPGIEVKLRLSQRTLLFSFLAYLTFLASLFVIGKDRESGFLLVNKLTKTGMTRNKVMDFLNEVIIETNTVLKDLGLKGNIRSVSPPSSSFKPESYLQKDIHFDHLIKSFRELAMMKTMNRMALRYEDDAYTHYILTKLITADQFGLNSKTGCVIPCRNISEDPLYFEDFFFFDLVILKDIDSLPLSHVKDFVKLWSSFEGKIIVTFCTYSFTDVDNEALYRLVKDHIVDFPSYFSNRAIYERMLEHTIDYIKPYTGEHEIDREDYLNDIYSMDSIKSRELRSFV